MNSSDGIIRSRDKLIACQMMSSGNIPVPITAQVVSWEDTNRAISRVGGTPCVVKSTEGTHGAGVFLAKTEQHARQLVYQMLEREMRPLVQEYIEESHGKDIRALVVGGKVVACMRRRANGDEFRSNFHLGGSVEKIDIDPDFEKIAIKAARILGLEIAGVDLAAAQSEMARSKASIDKSLISQLEYDEVVVRLKRATLTNNHAIESLKLQQEQLEFELKALELQLQRQRHISEELERKVAGLEIRSPLNGIVGNINIQQKQAVLRNTPLLSLVDLSAFEIEAQIPESYADELGLGFDANITLNGQSYAGKLTAISPEVNNGQVSGRIRLIEQIPGMRQNQRVSAQIIIEKKDNVLTLQRGAFVESGAGLKAYVVKDNLATKVKITLGARSTGKVEITSGLKPGDNVVISTITPFNDQSQVLITQ